MQKNFDVTIVGGGIIGNATALSLSQCGLSVALLSNEPDLRDLNQEYDARIFALSHNSVQLLKDLRVWDALNHERICVIEHMHIRGDAHDSELHLNASLSNQSQLAWIVEQNNIQRTLAQSIQFSPHITVIKSTSSTLEFTDLHAIVNTQNNQLIQSELLIGCDGANSWVRNACQIGVDTFDYALDGVVANFKCSHPHQNTAHQWFLSHGEVLALLPMPNQQVSMVYSCLPNTSQVILHMSPEQLCSMIESKSEMAVGNLTPLNTPQAFALKRSRAQRFIAPRVVLMGDAAHTVHPLAGQGLNLGLQDVGVLRHLLLNRPSHKSIADFPLLRRYERNRSAATSQMQGVTHALNRLFAMESPIIAHARNLGLSALNFSPALKSLLVKSASAQPNFD